MGASFAVKTTRQVQAKYLARWEIFKKIIPVHGNIFECGVHEGQGLMSWANFSAIMEPVNTTRKIIGIDTFEGIKELDGKDCEWHSNSESRIGGFKPSDKALSQLSQGIKDFDNNRFINQIEKIKLLKGKAEDTIPKYLEKHPETIVALLSLDFDIYQPTLNTLELLYNRMVKGGVIVFDQICNENWPGETQAVYEFFNKRFFKARIKRFPWTSTLSYLEVE